MGKRIYNVFFNTHTVSGIVISVALYIIFFTGAFALFKDEIEAWEKKGKAAIHTERKDIDFDFLLEKLDAEKHLQGRDIQFNLSHSGADEIFGRFTATKDSLAPKEARTYLYASVDIRTGETATYSEKYTLGEFLYRLHFFSQIPYIGIYLAGFVSLFFLFAIITGVIVHWKKIVSNFYQFNPKMALKRVWTDAHTALGVIGLPFQFIYAVTGTYFGLSILVLLPANFLYNNNQEKLMADLRPELNVADWIGPTEEKALSVNSFVKENAGRWNNFHLSRLRIENYGGTNMKYLLVGEQGSNQRFLSYGRVAMDAYTGKTTVDRHPLDGNYVEDIQLSVGRLHFGNFGGIPIKIIYFILALISCFVIITGVLIWIEARNKKSMSISQRLYTAKVGHIYLAICLSILPVTALSFLTVKLLPDTLLGGKMSTIYGFFFVPWLLAIVYFRFKRNNYFTNKVSLLSGAVLGFCVPIVNGLVSGNWIWNTFQTRHWDILTVDILWIFISVTAWFAYIKIKPSAKDKSVFTKLPIDYKNRKQLVAEKAMSMQRRPITVQTEASQKTKDKNHIPMRTKIILLWLFLAIGWIVHHIYGLFNIYYNETLVMEGATGEAPTAHHIYRILFEGLCLLFALLTLEISKKWFRWTSFIWAIVAGSYNVYHFVEAILYESGNISEIFMLALVTIASVFLLLNLNKWKRE